MGVAHPGQPFGDLGDGGVPIDLFVCAVGAAPHGRGEAVAAVLVVVEPQRLLAGVALRADVLLVAADTGKPPPVEPHFYPTVRLTENAGGLVPGGRVGGHRALPGPPARYASMVPFRYSMAASYPRTASVTV